MVAHLHRQLHLPGIRDRVAVAGPKHVMQLSWSSASARRRPRPSLLASMSAPTCCTLLQIGMLLARRGTLAAPAVQEAVCQVHPCGDWKNSPTARRKLSYSESISSGMDTLVAFSVCSEYSLKAMVMLTPGYGELAPRGVAAARSTGGTAEEAVPPKRNARKFSAGPSVVIWGDQQHTWSMVAHSRPETSFSHLYGVYHLAVFIATHVGAFWSRWYTFNITCR